MKFCTPCGKWDWKKTKNQDRRSALKWSSSLRESINYDLDLVTIIPHPKRGVLKIATQEESLQHTTTKHVGKGITPVMKSIRFKSIKMSKDCIKAIHFGSIEIREYGTILGDNPQCSNGVALTLDWDYNLVEHTPNTVEDYENLRLPRRKIKEMMLSADDREEILLRQGVTYEELNEATEALDAARLLRLQTINDANNSNNNNKTYRTKMSMLDRERRRKLLSLNQNMSTSYRNLFKQNRTDSGESLLWTKAQGKKTNYLFEVFKSSHKS